MLHELSFEYNPFNCSWQLVNEAGDITDSFTPPADKATVFPLAAEIAKNYPALTARAWKAAQLVEAGHVSAMKIARSWNGAEVGTVVSQEKISNKASVPKAYTIRHYRHHDDPADATPWLFSCECGDFHGRAPRVKHQKFCKHILSFLLEKEQEKRAYTLPRPQGEEERPSWLGKKYRDMSDAERSAFHAHQGALDRKAADERRARFQTYNALENARKRSPLAMTREQQDHFVDYHW